MHRLWFISVFAGALSLSAVAAQDLEVAGSVSDPRGAGLTGATVELRPLLPAYRLAELQLAARPGPQAVKRTRTDRDGEFRFHAPAAGFWTVAVRHPDYLPAANDLSPLLASRALGDLRMQRRSELAARLTDDQERPIGGVALWIAGWSQQWQQAAEGGWRPLERVVRTGPDGLAALPCASAETVTVAALHQDRFLYREERCEAGLVALALDARLRDARLIRDDGAPAEAYGFFRWPVLAFGASDEQGLVRGPFAEPEAVPVAFAGDLGYYGQPRWLAPAEDGKDASDDLPVLRLPPSVTLQGRAVDVFDNTPVDGVWLWVGRGSRYFQRLERGAFEVRVPEGTGRSSQRTPATVRFGGPGYLTIAYQPPPADDGDSPEGRSTQHSPEGRSTQHRVVKLTPAMTLSGRVVDAGGEGVADALVAGRRTHMAFGQRLSELQGGGLWQLDPIGATTAGDGSFELRRLPPLRPFEVRVKALGFAAHYETVPALEPAVPAEELVIVLERGVTGFGLVVNEHEIPIAGAEVALLPSLTGAAAEQSYEVKENHCATTGAGGRFTLRDLPAGRYYLSARAAGFPELLVPGIEIAIGEAAVVEAAVGAIGTEPIDLGIVVLVPGVELSGRVADAGGEPVAAAQLSLRNADGEQIVVQRADSLWFASARSRQNGSFHIGGLPRASRLVLLVSADGYLPRELAVTTSTEDQRLDVELSRGARVTGVVLDPGGRPAAGARVDLVAGPELQRMSTSTSRTVETDEEGRFEALGLRPGDYTLGARLDAAESEPLPRRVPAAGLRDVYLELRRKATLSVTVRDPQGEPVAQALVMAIVETGGASRRSRMQTTDGQGLAVLQPLDAGVYRLIARHGKLGSVEAPVEVATAGDQQFELRFGPRDGEERARVEVSGRVVDPAGLPVSGATVWLEGARIPLRTANGADGGFSLQAPPGEYRLSCRHQRFAAYLGEPFTVAAGGVSGIVVELSEGAVVTGRIGGLELEELARLVVTARGPLRRTEGASVFGQRYGTVDFAGSLRIEGLGAGEWMVRAELLNPTRSASERIEITGDGEVRVDLRFEPGHRLTGSVLGPVGPLAGCTVSVSCTAELRGRTFTDDAGRFVFDHLSEGHCRLSAIDPDSGRSTSQRLELISDTDVVLEIRPVD